MSLLQNSLTGILASVLLFLTLCVIALIYKRVFHWIVLFAVLMFAWVFIEPSPSDLVFATVIPLGLITGIYRPKLEGKALAAALVLFSSFVASIPGLFYTQNQTSALRYLFITFYLFVMAMFICTYADGKTIDSLLRAYVAAACISFLAGFLGYLGFFPDLLMEDEFRVKGLFKDPNVFGPFFVPSILLLIDDVGRKTILKKSAFIHWFTIILLTLGVVFSFSRAAWISLAASVSIYFLLKIGSLRFGQIVRILLSGLLMLSIAALLFFSPLLSGTGIPQFIQERARLQEYDRERFNAQQGGLELVAQNPLGYGAGQFEDEIDHVTQYKMDAHSLYIRTAVENGVLGFLLYFAALFFLLWELLLRRRDAVFAILFGLLVNSLVVDTIHWRHFWFFIGIGFYYLKEYETAQSFKYVKGLHSSESDIRSKTICGQQ